MNLRESSHPSPDQIARGPGVFLERAGGCLKWCYVIALHLLPKKDIFRGALDIA
jgi:hypothetical protein